MNYLSKLAAEAAHPFLDLSALTNSRTKSKFRHMENKSILKLDDVSNSIEVSKSMGAFVESRVPEE